MTCWKKCESKFGHFLSHKYIAWITKSCLYEAKINQHPKSLQTAVEKNSGIPTKRKPLWWKLCCAMFFVWQHAVKTCFTNEILFWKPEPRVSCRSVWFMLDLVYRKETFQCHINMSGSTEDMSKGCFHASSSSSSSSTLEGLRKSLTCLEKT